MLYKFMVASSRTVDPVPLLWATTAQGNKETHTYHTCPKAAKNIDTHTHSELQITPYRLSEELFNT